MAGPRHTVGFQQWEKEWEGELEELFVKLKEEREELRKLHEAVHKAQEKCQGTMKKCKRNFAEATAELKIAASRDPGINASKYQETIELRKQQLKRTANQLPMPIGTLLTLLLGSVNLTLPHFGDRFKYKQEYEKLKLNATWATITWAAICIFFFPTRPLESLYHLFLAWYYGSIIVRELILRANGSSIRYWWLFHHYCMIFLSGTFLTLPGDQRFHSFRQSYLVFSLYLGLVQLLQYKYQAQVIYRKMAMDGSRSRMHITSESPGMSSFTTLIVALALAYLFQLYLAFDLWGLHTEEWCIAWQVPAASAVFAVLGAGNFAITSDVAVRKFFPNAAKVIGLPKKRHMSASM